MLGKLDKVEETFEDMKKEGVKPNGVTYRSIIAACYNSGNPNRVEELKKEAKAAGIDIKVDDL